MSRSRLLHRPSRGFKGPYNVPRRGFYSSYKGPIWCERRDVTLVDYEEFARVELDIAAALCPYGYVHYDKRGLDFLIKYNWCCDSQELDRTLRVEVRLFERTPELHLAVLDVQQALQRHPLWRVLFDAWSQSTENIFVYPDTIRLAQWTPGRSLKEAIDENVRQRREWIQGQPSHQRKRLVQLEAAVKRAIRSLSRIGDRAMVACWFDTITYPLGPPDGCFRDEGLPGTSIWIVRKPLDDHYWPETMSSSLDFKAIQWANQTGHILTDRELMSSPRDRESFLRDRYQVINFYSVGKRRSSVRVTFDGTRYRFTAPDTE